MTKAPAVATKAAHSSSHCPQRSGCPAGTKGPSPKARIEAHCSTHRNASTAATRYTRTALPPVGALQALRWAPRIWESYQPGGNLTDGGGRNDLIIWNVPGNLVNRSCIPPRRAGRRGKVPYGVRTLWCEHARIPADSGSLLRWPPLLDGPTSRARLTLSLPQYASAYQEALVRRVPS